MSDETGNDTNKAMAASKQTSGVGEGALARMSNSIPPPDDDNDDDEKDQNEDGDDDVWE